MENKRICRYCNIEFSLDSFPIMKKNGKEYYRHRCKDCYKQSKRLYEKDKSQWLEFYKKQLCCKNCGNDDYRVLEFHHTKSKKFNIGDSISRGYSKEKIILEIKKCEVLCANCHRIETYEARKNNVNFEK